VDVILAQLTEDRLDRDTPVKDVRGGLANDLGFVGDDQQRPVMLVGVGGRDELERAGAAPGTATTPRSGPSART
jgi:hypothetical protein